MPTKHVTECAEIIAAKGWTIAFAESATAGRMSAEFSLTEYSGKILRGGICCYDFFVKEQILKISSKLIEDFTAESAEVTEMLARNALRLFNSKVVIAVTGLTTPGGSETPEKPVGTMFLQIITPAGSISHREVFTGNAEEIVLQTIDKAAQLIIQQVQSN